MFLLRRSVVAPILAAVVAMLSFAAAGAAKPAKPPIQAADFDVSQKIDVNQISMFVTNTGSFAYDKTTGNAGFEYPRGSGMTAVFAAGPWFGATVGGSTRIALSEYSDEFGPGAAPSGVPEAPGNPDLRVFKLRRSYATTGERDSALLDYQLHAEPRGARHVGVLSDGTLDILGDQMLWSVFNDLDPANHTNRAGMTPPLGIEVQQTTYAFDRPGALGRTVFVAYRVLNRSGAPLEDLRFGMWSDPDLGDFRDDLVGCDSLRSLGYAYNAGPDTVYGANPPSVGFDVLLAHRTIDAPGSGSAFIKYVNGTDPTSARQTFNYLHGLHADGTAIVDPTTSQITTFMVPGDPVTATGWLDDTPGDRRMTPCVGPWLFGPADTLEIVVAVVVGQGADPLDSITHLRADDAFVQAFFDGGSTPPPLCPVTVTFDFHPNRLNLRSMGRWVSGRIEPPPPLLPADIDVGSILLAGSVPVDPSGPITIGDGDGNGTPDLTVKFDRAAVQAVLASGDSVPVSVTGTIGDVCFVGGDMARTLRTPVVTPPAGAVITPGIVTPVRWQTPEHAQPMYAAVLTSTDGGNVWSLAANHVSDTGEFGWHAPYAPVSNQRIAVVLVEHEISAYEVEGVLGIGPGFSVGNTTGVIPGSPAFTLLGAAPHPARGSFRIGIRLPAAAPATLSPYDLSG